MSGKISEDVLASEEVLKKNLTKALPLLEKAGIVGLIEPINPYRTILILAQKSSKP